MAGGDICYRHRDRDEVHIVQEKRFKRDFCEVKKSKKYVFSFVFSLFYNGFNDTSLILCG